MNRLGRIFSVQIFGESHGPMVGVVIDGCIPGISILESDFLYDLERRRSTGLNGTTPRKEEDTPVILSGVFQGKTTGAPLTVAFYNKDVQSGSYELHRQIPRPGHADFTASKKFYGHNDYRGSGHFSGRLTLPLTAAGVIAKKILQTSITGKINIQADLIEAGGQKDIASAIQQAILDQDSIGGIIECKVQGLPIGLGEPFFDSIESMISHAVFSIPAVKGIAFGSGFSAATMKGSEHNDAIIDTNGKTTTNNAGGINGGLTNGNELIFHVAIKPTSSTPQEQSSINVTTGRVEDFQVKGRHDLCIALRAPVVVEAVTAIVLADFLLIKKSQQQ